MESDLVEAIPDAVVLVAEDGRIVSVNAYAETLFGYPRHELTGQPIEMLVPASLRLEHVRHRVGYAAAPHTRPLGTGLTLRARRKDGSELPVDISLAPLARGSARHVMAVVRDASGRAETERALRASEHKYRVLFDSIPLAAVVHDAQSGRIESVNDAAVQQYGYSREELRGMRVPDLAAPEASAGPRGEEPPRPRPSADGTAQYAAQRHRKKNGSLIDVEVISHAAAFGERPSLLSIMTDVTERRQLEEQLRQAQKLEAIGRLAGGVAHDFNNALAAILGISGVVLEDLREDDPLRNDLEDIRSAGERAAGLTRQLLAFSRKQVSAPRPVDLNAVVREVERMLRRLIGEDIELELRLMRTAATVVADPTQIEQVIVNLAVNARDAMPAGGKLTIETAHVELDGSYAQAHTEVTPGPHVMLAVSDTGQGMDDAVKARLFEPFFTTKGSGGTGLGLATVYGVVKQAGGSIWVYSEPGRGTTFKLYLPSTATLEATPISRSSLLPSATGVETVLLVEDDEGVRAGALAILGRRGYTLLTARNATEALALHERHAGPIHLVLTDVVMPGMNGRALAERLTALRPELRVLYMSGYTDSTIAHHGVLDPDAYFIQKPFTPDSLSRKVREVLDRDRSPPDGSPATP